MKKIHSERHVNKQGIIPYIYKQNINELIDRVEKLENSMISEDIDYGVIKSYKNFNLWFEPITDTVNGFVMRKKGDGSIIGIFPEQVLLTN